MEALPEGWFDFSEPDDFNIPEESTLPEEGDAVDILRRFWGYDSFRPLQEDIINSVVSGNDTIGLLPTGGGKSITFQVPALMLGGVTLVVTPLISLMKDQVDHLRKLDIPAGCLHSGMSRRESNYVTERAAQGKLRLLYVAPERLNQNFVAQLHSWDLSLIVVDEAHCISQWGYDFRPSYLRINILREEFPETPILALTASATRSVIRDIAQCLQMRSAKLFALSFRRENIAFRVQRTEEKLIALYKAIEANPGCAIVYVRSRKRSAELAASLVAMGLKAVFYHAGLDDRSKSRAQDEWMRGDTPVMVATSAFGMGIDKPDVRIVVHYDMPSTLEEYYQEAGRAGRDGLPSLALTLASQSDKSVFAKRLRAEFPPKETIRFHYDELCRYLDVPMGGGYKQLYEFRPEAICLAYNLPARQLLASLRILTRAGYIEYMEETATPTRVKFKVSREELYHVETEPLAEEILENLLRNYPGLFADYTIVSDERIALDCRCTVDQVYESLITLRRAHIIDFIPKNRTPYIYFPNVRVESRNIIFDRTVYEDRIEVTRKRLDAMKDFVFADTGCRVRRMLAYFDETDSEPCGKCDLCAPTGPFNPVAFLNRIKALAATSPDGFVSAAELRRHFPDHLREASTELQRLIDAGIVVRDGVLLSIR